VAIWSLATFGSGLAPTFAILLLARAVVGVGEASYAIVTPSLISDLYPPDRRGGVMAIFYAAISVGVALGYILGGRMGESYGWQAAFFVAGAPGLLLAGTLLLLPEPTRGALDPGHASAPTLALRDALAALRKRPSYWFNTAAQTIYTFAIGGLGVWMPIYFVRERHLGRSQATDRFGIALVLAGLFGTMLGGALGDVLARRFAGAHFTVSAVALIATVPFTLLAVLSPHPAIFWPAMFVVLLLLFLNTGPLNAAMANVLPATLRARGFSIYTVAIHLFGDAISPPIIGKASDLVGLRLPVLVCGLIVVFAGLLLLLGRRHLVADLQREAA
jgi:MFS family permease